MSGFDNGTLQSGIYAQTKQFGAVLRGNGPPVPTAGIVGDTYIDIQTWQLYVKRANDKTDPWGHYLFAVPVDYQATLKWFSSAQPGDSVGVDGDYCLMWGAFPNYGLLPSIIGPKAAGAWPTNPVSPAIAYNPLYSAEDAHTV